MLIIADVDLTSVSWKHLERSRDRLPMVSLDFSVTYSFRPYHGPGVDSAHSENEYQEYFLEVKAVGAW